MYLTRHATPHGPRWAVDDIFLAEGLGLDTLLSLPGAAMSATLKAAQTGIIADGELLPPIEHAQEAWAAGVTYLRSREARMAESDTADIYEKVYEAERVEVFFKAIGWRAMGPGQPIRVRKDSTWDVPEPELAIVINASGDIVGYTAGNDVSSRSIEGENPLYLPQAKVYDGSCAIGPGIVIAGPDAQRDLPITRPRRQDRVRRRDRDLATQARTRRDGRMPVRGSELPARCNFVDRYLLGARGRIHADAG